MFCIKRVHNCEKRSKDEKAHAEYVFEKMKSSRSIMVFLSLIVKTKKQNMEFFKLPKRSPFPENGKKEVC
jgi:tRNA 2-selenouridine synthase SelU